jgi:drug/metabolite transporter (DMT)-like permease
VTLWLGVGLAVLAAIAGNVGSLLRQRGAVAAPDVDVRRPLRSAIDLFRSKWWTIGYLVAFVSWGFHVGALSLADLSIVQAVLAGGMVFLAVIAERYFGFKLQKRQWLGVTLAAAGLAMLSLTGGSRSGQGTAHYSVLAMILVESALAALGAALILSQGSDRLRSERGVVLGLSAGLLFTATHVAIKATTGKLDHSVVTAIVNPFLLIAVGGAVAAFFASARSLQLGPAVPVIAVGSIAGNASAIPAGIVVFGDPLGSSAGAIALRTAAFVLVVGATALIPAPVRAGEEVKAREADALETETPEAGAREGETAEAGAREGETAEAGAREGETAEAGAREGEAPEVEPHGPAPAAA